MKKIRKVLAMAIVGATLFTMTAFAANKIPNGSVILGDKAYGLDYANKKTNESEITQAVVNSRGKVYIKLFTGGYVDNTTLKPVEESQIKVGNYKDENGTVVIDDSTSENSDELEILSIE